MPKSGSQKSVGYGQPGSAGHGNLTGVGEREGSFIAGWPALVITLAMIVAACFAFLRPPLRTYPPTRITPDDILTNGLARQGDHYIVVGADGFIFTANRPGGPWRKAEVQPQRELALTRVRFISKNTALAVGHGGWILRSTDAGKTWHEVAYDKKSSGALFGIAGPFSGTLYAYGAYGKFLVSSDRGKHWQVHPLKEAPEKENRKSDAGTDEKASSDKYSAASVFGQGMVARPLSQRHIYGMAQADDGSLVLVGESGLIARSTDGARTWHVEDRIYQGSFYGILNLPEGGLLVYGMGGHVFARSPGDGAWHRVKVPAKQSLFTGKAGKDGIALGGAEDILLLSTDGGRHFVRESLDGPSDLTSILELPNGGLLTSGTAHLKIWNSKPTGTVQSDHAPPESDRP